MRKSDGVNEVRQLVRRELEDFGEQISAARAAPRCVHVKTNGVRCGSPALRRQPFCFFHERVYNPPYEADFPLLEDANAIQMAIQQVLEGLRRGKVELRTAGMMLYGLQTAAANIRHASLEPSPWKVVMVDPILEQAEKRRAEEEASERAAG